MIEIFKNQKNRLEIQIISETGNIYYFPQILTVREVEEILYALYGEYIDWTSTAKRNFSTDELTYVFELTHVLRRRVNQNPEKNLSEVFNPNNLRAYAEEIFSAALWYDIQDAKEQL